MVRPTILVDPMEENLFKDGLSSSEKKTEESLSLFAEEKLDEGESSEFSTLSSNNQHSSHYVGTAPGNVSYLPNAQSPVRNPSDTNSFLFLTPSKMEETFASPMRNGHRDRIQELNSYLEENEKQLSNYIQVLQTKSSNDISQRIKEVQNWAFTLGLKEATEMERGKSLNILGSSKTPTKMASNFMEKHPENNSQHYQPPQLQ